MNQNERHLLFAGFNGNDSILGFDCQLTATIIDRWYTFLNVEKKLHIH